MSHKSFVLAAVVGSLSSLACEASSSNEEAPTGPVPPSLMITLSNGCQVSEGVTTQAGGRVIIGTDGDDKVFCQFSSLPGVIIIGLDGNDFLNDTNGPDKIYGGGRSDDIQGFSGDDELSGGPGDDQLDGDDGDDVMRGGPGDDSLNGFGDNDTLDGGPGNDSLYGNEGNDSLSGGAGDSDRCVGGTGSDQFSASCETVIQT